MIVAVPLYRSPGLLPGLFASLIDMADEFRALGASLLLINDSPDDPALADALARELPPLEHAIATELLTNSSNLGFVRSANVALARAVAERCDVILLNSDAMPRRGAFAEMVAVAALDPMIGSVCPRSDNATICNSPYHDSMRAGGRAQSYAAHAAIERHLPRVTYVPTNVGFCMLVRWPVLAEFGLFDETYGGGYNEENDLVCRFNRRGYRAVLANRAYVHHIGQASFALSDTPSSERDRVNNLILVARYPEYWPSLDRFFEGAEFQAQRVLAGLVRDHGRLRLLFDCRGLDCVDDDAGDYARGLLRALVSDGADVAVDVLCDHAAFRFHGLDAAAGLRHLDAFDRDARPYAAALRIGAPTRSDDLAVVQRAAAVCGVLLLDTAALDCARGDDADRHALWSRMASTLDLIGFASQAGRDRFGLRVAVPPTTHQFVAACSMRVEDYAENARPAGPDLDGDIVVLGGPEPHDGVEETLRALREAAPAKRIAVAPALGSSGRPATIVVPDHHDELGLGILRALARSVPVVARDLPAARAIAAQCPAAVNLRLAGTTAELADRAVADTAWTRPVPGTEPVPGWPDTAAALMRAITGAMESLEFDGLRTRFALTRREDPAPARPEIIVAAPSAGQAVVEIGSIADGRSAKRPAPWHDRLGIFQRNRAPRNV